MKRFQSKTLTERIKIRLKLLWLACILMIIYAIVIGEVGWGDTRKMSDLAENISTMIYFGGVSYIIFQIVKNKKRLNNKHLLLSGVKKLTDEREQFLRDKSGGIIINILILLLLLVTCTTAMINMAAFNISLLILFITLLLKAGSYFVYSRIY